MKNTRPPDLSCREFTRIQRFRPEVQCKFQAIKDKTKTIDVIFELSQIEENQFKDESDSLPNL